jgi:hypothetical protein
MLNKRLRCGIMAFILLCGLIAQLTVLILFNYNNDLDTMVNILHVGELLIWFGIFGWMTYSERYIISDGGVIIPLAWSSIPTIFGLILFSLNENRYNFNKMKPLFIPIFIHVHLFFLGIILHNLWNSYKHIKKQNQQKIAKSQIVTIHLDREMELNESNTVTIHVARTSMV